MPARPGEALLGADLKILYDSNNTDSGKLKAVAQSIQHPLVLPEGLQQFPRAPIVRLAIGRPSPVLFLYYKFQLLNK